MVNRPNMISSRYDKTSIILALLFSLLCFVSEFEIYRTKIQNKLIGLNQAWQSNANLESKIKDNYPDYVISSYKDIENFIGFKNDENIKKWFDGYLEKAYNTDVTVKFINNMMINGKEKIVHWKTGSDVDIVDDVSYDHGQMIINPKDTDQDFELRIFQQYFDYIKYTLPELSAGKINPLSLNDFDRYNDIALKHFYPDNLKDFVLISPYIKIHRFFIASYSKQTNSDYYGMAVFPLYKGQSFPNLIVPYRPWYLATVFNKFPLHYQTPDQNYAARFGLTGLYNDISTVTTTVLDRTLTCAFTIPNLRPNVHFIACIDLFFDNSAKFVQPNPFTLSRNADVGYTSFTSYFPFFGVPNLPLGYCTLIDSFLLFWIIWGLFQIDIIKKYSVRGLEGIVNQFNSGRIANFNLSRQAVYTLNTENIRNPPKITVETEFSDNKNKERSNERGFGVDGKWWLLSIFFKKTAKNSRTRAENKTSKETNELVLGIDNINYYRRIEFWKIYNKSKTREIGEFMVKWMNTIFTKEEIAIDLRGELDTKIPKEDLNRALVYLKKEFELRLLTGDESEFQISIDLTQTLSRPIKIPYSIESIQVKGETILQYFTRMGRLNRFYEKKLFFRYRDKDDKELRYFLQLYDNMHTYSICGIAFLKNLELNKGLLKFIKSTGDKERLFIETTEKEFANFISGLDDLTKLKFEELDTAKFRIHSYCEEHAEAIEKYKNYDFAIVKNYNDETEYILYHTPTSTVTEIGWCSWRAIDIDFYSAVYVAITTELRNDSMSISEYIQSMNVKK